MAHFAHYNLGFSRSALREQALICAALVAGLVTVEMLASKETIASEPTMRIIELAVALTIFIGSAGVAALLTVLLVRYGWESLAVLRLNALISAGALCFVSWWRLLVGLTREKGSERS